jgi:hypothetical protein
MSCRVKRFGGRKCGQARAFAVDRNGAVASLEVCDRSTTRRIPSTDRTPACSSARDISAEEQARHRAAIDAILALRDSGEIKPVTREEIIAWRHEDHRY